MIISSTSPDDPFRLQPDESSTFQYKANSVGYKCRMENCWMRLKPQSWWSMIPQSHLSTVVRCCHCYLTLNIRVIESLIQYHSLIVGQQWMLFKCFFVHRRYLMEIHIFYASCYYFSFHSLIFLYFTHVRKSECLATRLPLLVFPPIVAYHCWWQLADIFSSSL